MEAFSEDMAFRLDSKTLPPAHLSSLVRHIGLRLGRRRFSSNDHDDFPFFILTLTNKPLNRPFHLLSRRRAQVTTWQMDGFCVYASIGKLDYLAACCLFALTQLRTLSLNPLIEAEDMLFDCDPGCLFSAKKRFEDYARVFEQGSLCSGCKNFYHYLGADRELLSLGSFPNFC